MQSPTTHAIVSHSQAASSSNSKFPHALCLVLLALSGFVLPASADAQEAATAKQNAAVEKKTAAQEQATPAKAATVATDPYATTTPRVTAPSTTVTAASVAQANADTVPTGALPNAGSMITVSRTSVLIGSLTIFMLAVFVGFEIITKVPPTLHTPLMSGSNAISGITVVGAVLTAGAAAATSGAWFGATLGMLAAVLAMINVVGGFMVTHRMLMMFKKR